MGLDINCHFCCLFAFDHTMDSIQRNQNRVIYRSADDTETLSMFQSQWLAISSYLCIAFGPVVPMMHSLQYITDEMCYLSLTVCISAAILQMLFMEYFQLSRLHYCFSRSQLHSDKGYPKWLFVSMFIAVTIVGITWMVTWIHIAVHRDCLGQSTSINDELQSMRDDSVVALSICAFITLQILDLFTVYLYWNKLRVVIKQQSGTAVHDNVQVILYRILILTIFYNMVVAAMYISFSFASIHRAAYSLSMYLMMDHNHEEYRHFLHILHRFKLYWCCCCCGPMVKKHHECLQVRADTVVQVRGVVAVDAKGETKGAHHLRAQSVIDTEYSNISKGLDPAILPHDTTGMTLSLDTVTEQRSPVTKTKVDAASSPLVA